ncbi:MAG: HAMP domain-containing protein [Geminicoccaceae bacterium]|nr:MAG: HAMP domain-containing protein [Geminicoccaceae bacterium]
MAVAIGSVRRRPSWWRRWRAGASGVAVLPRSLFGRSLLIVVLPVLILQIILTNIFYNRHWDSVSRWLSSGVAGEVAWIVEQLEGASTTDERRAILDGARRHLQLAVSLEPGGQLEPAAERSGFLPAEQLDQLLQGSFANRLEHPFRVDTRPADQLRRVAVYVQLDDALLRVLAPRKRVDSSTTTLFMAWMVSASLLLVVIAIYFLSRQVRPIRRLADAADSFGKGRDVGDVKLEGAIEIRRAALAYNRMRQRIVRHMAQRTEMLAAVSHDLSTPLTRMNLELELMRTAPARVEDLDGLRADVAEMRRLIDAYLDFARGEIQETMQTVPLAKLMQRLQLRAARNRQPVRFEIGDEGAITVRPVAVERMLANLIDNAAKYGTTVRVRASLERDWVTFEVLDDGPGIAPADRERAFEPFVRLDAARRPENGGIGMGLTIARDVALAHGGSIKLGDSELGGLGVLIRLPL